MARKKITAESRLRTENTLLAEEVRKLEQLVKDQNATVRSKNSEIASRDASIAELHHQLAVSERERTLAEERLGDYLSAVQVQARLLGEAAAASERLRYPEPKR